MEWASGFSDFFAGNTTGADISTLDCSIEINFDSLEIREKASQGLADNLGSGPAGPFDLSTSFVFVAWYRACMADGTLF